MTIPQGRMVYGFLAGVVAGVALGALATYAWLDGGRGAAPGIATIDANRLGRIVEEQVDHVTVDDLAAWIVEGRTDFLLVDVRTPQEYAEWHLPRARNIPLAQLGKSDVLRHPKVVLYSGGGIHAAQAWFLLEALGHPGVYTLLGGMDEWKDAFVTPELAPDASAAERALFARRAKLAAALRELR